MDSAAPKQKGKRGYQKHGLSRVMKRKQKSRSKETVQFRAELIADAGGIENMSAAKRAAADILTAKYYRLLRAYRWQYQQPSPPIINLRKKALYPIVREIDALEDSFFRCAKEFGFARVAKELSLQELFEQDDTADAATAKTTGTEMAADSAEPTQGHS
jgi:hypothetical protein